MCATPRPRSGLFRPTIVCITEKHLSAETSAELDTLLSAVLDRAFNVTLWDRSHDKRHHRESPPSGNFDLIPHHPKPEPYSSQGNHDDYSRWAEYERAE